VQPDRFAEKEYSVPSKTVPLLLEPQYEHRGTANVFCVVEPKAGRHFTFATPDRSRFEFAQVICRLALAYAEAKIIHLGLDNLNIHCRKSSKSGSSHPNAWVAEESLI